MFPPGYRIGHATDALRRTGCTVVLPPPGTVAAVDVRGGAPGTRETGIFTPGNLVSEIHAVVFAGGSALGLEAATGVSLWLRERGVGYAIGPARVPIVSGAVLFDLAVGDAGAFPDAAMGRSACDAAAGPDPASGPVGAGAGAMVGKLLGDLKKFTDCRIDALGVSAGNVRSLQRLNQIAHQILEQRFYGFNFLEIAFAEDATAGYTRRQCENCNANRTRQHPSSPGAGGGPSFWNTSRRRYPSGKPGYQFPCGAGAHRIDLGKILPEA